jgi:magnesium transporter
MVLAGEVWYNREMHKIIEGPKVTWIDIQDPDEDDIEYLKKANGFHPMVLEELIPPAWRIKVESFTSYLFFIFYYPVYSKEHRHTRARELDVIVGKNVLVTSHYNSIVPLKGLFDRCNLYPEKKGEYMNQTAGYLLYHVLNEMRQSTLLRLDRINKKLHTIEDEIFGGHEQQMLREISLTKADIINFWSIVNPQGEILESLRKEGKAFFGEDLSPYFGHLLGDWSQARNDLQTYKEAIEALEQTNNSLLTDKTNEIVKLLTIFSVIVFPLTLLAAIFGMNTQDLPLTGYAGDFWVISAVMLTGILGMIGFFKWKKFF